MIAVAISCYTPHLSLYQPLPSHAARFPPHDPFPSFLRVYLRDVVDRQLVPEDIQEGGEIMVHPVMVTQGMWSAWVTAVLPSPPVRCAAPPNCCALLPSAVMPVVTPVPVLVFASLNFCSVIVQTPFCEQVSTSSRQSPTPRGGMRFKTR